MNEIPKKGQRVRIVEVAANGHGIVLPVGTEIKLVDDARAVHSNSVNHWVQLPLGLGANLSSSEERVWTRQMRVELVGGPSEEMQRAMATGVTFGLVTALSIYKQSLRLKVTSEGAAVIDWELADARFESTHKHWRGLTGTEVE